MQIQKELYFLGELSGKILLFTVNGLQELRDFKFVDNFVC
jgi:hypothetical protein